MNEETFTSFSKLLQVSGKNIPSWKDIKTKIKPFSAQLN
jgi:hypothetical protein